MARSPHIRLAWGAMWVALALIPLLFLGVFFAWPTVTLIVRGFIDEGGALDLSAFTEVFSRPRTWRIIGLTLGMATVATVISVLLGFPGAHILYCRQFPGQSLARGLIAVPFVLPTVVVGVAFRSLLGPGGWWAPLGLEESVTAVIAAMVFFNYSLVVRGVGSTWSRLDPRLVQAARALGATPVRAFFTVTMPALLPAIASVASVVFLYCATAFGIVLILGGNDLATIESEIYQLTTSYLDLRSASVLSIVQLAVVALALFIANRARSAGQGALHLRADPLRRPISRSDGPAAAITTLVILGLLATPIAQLLWRSFHRKGAFTLANWIDLTRSDFSRAVRISAFEAAANSLIAATSAAALALIIGVSLALVVTRSPQSPLGKRALALLDGAFMLPLGVSAVTVGFGFLLTLGREPFDLLGSPWLVPVAQAVVAVPLVVRLIAPILRAIHPRQREVAAALGASPLRVLVTIDGAHLVRGGAVAAGFAFATSLGEFGATSFLARSDAPTLPVYIFRLISRPGAPEQGVAVAASVFLALIAATIMVLVERGRPSTSGEFA